MKFIQTTLLSVLLFQTSYAENWPQFRGPTGQGISNETDVPVKWSATEHVAWKCPIPGEAWSSPIVLEDRVFVTTATDEGKSCHVFCIDLKSGDLLWNKEVFQQELKHKEGRNTYATPTPTTDGQRVYACFGDGSFVALNFNGEVQWTNRDYPFYGQHGLGTAMVLHNDLLMMARDGSSSGEDTTLGWQKPWDQAFVVALDTKTGQQRWKTGRGQSRISHGTPIVSAQNDNAILVSEAGDVLQGFEIASGKLLWSTEVVGEGKVPSTVINNGVAFTSGGWGGNETIKAFKLPVKNQEATLLWEQKKGMPKVPSMLVADQHLYTITDNGVASCIATATGEIIWQERLGGNFSASPVTANGKIYFTSDDGETSVIQSGSEFVLVAKNILEEKVQASIAISQGNILIRTEHNLICIR
jgi:outer membrane protein assembly factor BamB